mmetsp:Transcript_57088/g.131401  ORF Transcript_57088/g.131401 Transcript_57088/m.131401 type:complete len:138 (+) Transcript_57088:56-469(+)
MRCSAIFVAAAASQGVYSPTSDDPRCANIQCGDLNCVAPFKFQSTKDAGTCCPVCITDDPGIVLPYESPAGLTGGIGPNPNADPVRCAGVVCPKPMCHDEDQMYSPEQGFDKETMCCTRCKGGGMAMPPKSAAFGES